MTYRVIVFVLWMNIIKALDICTEESKLVKPGGTAVFLCEGKENERAWIKDGTTLKLNTEVTPTTDKRFKFDAGANVQTMTITNVKQTDSGRYQCEDTTSSNIITQQHLCVNQPARILSQSDSNVETVEGSTADLWCNATFKSKVEWYITDGVKEIGIGILGAKLEIRGITRYCPLSYTCNASNIDFEQVDSRIFHINVLFPPDIEISVLRQRDFSSMDFISPDVHNGQDGPFIVLEQVPTRVKMNCTVYSSPHNITYWYFDDQKIASMDMSAQTEDFFEDVVVRGRYLFEGIKDSADLYIFYMEIVMYESGLGKYTCRSMNAHSTNGDTLKSMTIKVGD